MTQLVNLFFCTFFFPISAEEGSGDSAVCGGTVTTAGILTSPEWPNYAPASTNCTWIISIPNAEGYTIVPKNTTVNNVARFRLKDDINYHFMIDPGLVATPNQFKKFESATSFWGPELVIEYWLLDENSTSRFEIDIYPFDYSNVPDSLCGYEITSPGSIITTENHPGAYDSYDECKWKLNVPDVLSYSLEKKDFNVDTLGRDEKT